MSQRVLTPLKAIKEYCKACSGGSVYEIKYCSVAECALFAFKNGHKPPKDYVPMVLEEKNKR